MITIKLLTGGSKYILSACLLMVAITTYSQVKLDESKSHLEYPDAKHTERRDAFFAKLDSFENGKLDKISILHLGDSHIQAGIETHTMRCHFDSLNRGIQSEFGILFPFTAAKTNNPPCYKVTSTGEWTMSRNVLYDGKARLGASGIAVYTTDPSATITVKLNADSSKRWQCNAIKVLGYSTNGTTPVITISDSTDLYPVYNAQEESYLFDCKQLTDSFTLRLKSAGDECQFTLCGFLPLNGNGGIVYHSIGVNGAEVPSYLLCENFERDLKLIKPDMVIFALGGNDAVRPGFNRKEYIADCDSLIDVIERVSPNCFFIFIATNDIFIRDKKHPEVKVVNKKNPIAVRALREVARKHRGGYWNFFEWQGGLGSMKKWTAAGLGKTDIIHFTEKGYTFIGDTLFKMFMESYKGR